MRLGSAIKWLCALAAAWMLLWLSVAAHLFSQEDYAPRRGSLTYYVGISSLVRGAPLVEPAGEPAYFGSVGDGNKPPQSEVSYETLAADPRRVWSTLEKYLDGRGFAAQAPQAGAPVDSSPNQRVLKSGEFRSASGEMVEVVLTQAVDSGRRSLRISHFD